MARGRTRHVVADDPVESDEEEAPTYTAAPWPRPDAEPFKEDEIPLRPQMTMTFFRTRTGFHSRTPGEAWQNHNSVVYNGSLYAKIIPTRVLDHDILRRMGIQADVLRMLDRMGLRTFFTTHHNLYPEIVRQFISSCEVTYEDPAFPMASKGKLTFLYRGELYSITIPELCVAYGFNPYHERVTLPNFQTRSLWGSIAAGPGPGKEAKLTHVRNPAVRVVSKIVGHLLFGQYEAGAMSRDQMILIHYGLPDFIESFYRHEKVQPEPTLEVNLGAIFAQTLMERRFRLIDVSKTRTEHLGSLLTPIFQATGVDLGNTECDSTIARFDENFMKRATLLKDNLVYRYSLGVGNYRQMKLPRPELTALTSLENLTFLHDDISEEETDDIPETSAGPSIPTGSTSEPVEFILPPYDGQFDPAPLAADATEIEILRWMADDNRKRFSMSKAIWDALSKIPVPRCFRDPDVAGRRTDQASSSRPSRKRTALQRSASPPARQ